MMQSLRYLLGLFPFLIFLLIPKNTDAYIDPATGSFILQMLLATLFATTFAIKLYWKKIKTFMIKHFSKQPSEEQKDN